MKTQAIRELSVEEMQLKMRELREQLLRLRLKKTSGQIEKTHQFKDLRRTIARLETIVRERSTINA